MAVDTQVYGIVGGRAFDDYGKLCRDMDAVITEHGPPSAFVSGGAEGADKLGERYAMERFGMTPIRQDHECERLTDDHMNVFYPDWNGPHGKKAGLARNILIATHCTVLVAFPVKGSTGTYHTIGVAQEQNKIVKVFKSP